MFIGHYGVGFALKKLNREISLGFLFLAVMLQDILWNVLVLIGVEEVQIAKGVTKVNPLNFVKYPYSHGLISNVLMAVAVFLLASVAIRGRERIKSAGLVATAVISHFILDVISHRPDMPVFFSHPKIGLGLWNHVFASYFVETSIFIIGFVLYYKTTEGLKRWKKVSVTVFGVLLAGTNFLNLTGTVPPSSKFLASTGIGYTVIFLALAFWFDSRPKTIGHYCTEEKSTNESPL